MKLSLLILFLLAASAAVAADASKGPAMRPRLTDELRRQAEDMTSVPTSSAPAPVSSAGVTVLTPMKVTGSYQPLLRSLEMVSPKSHPFTWKEGGTFWKHQGKRFTTEVKFQYDPVTNQTSFFSLSW